MKKFCTVSFLLLVLFLLVGCKAEPEFSVATLPAIDGVTAECVAEREGEEWQISVKVKNTTSEAVTIKVALTAQAPFAADRYLFPGINYNGNGFGEGLDLPQVYGSNNMDIPFPQGYLRTACDECPHRQGLLA